MSESWVNEDGPNEFLKNLKRQYNSEVEMLIGAAKDSTDSRITRSWSAINVLARVIRDMEAERGKSTD